MFKLQVFNLEDAAIRLPRKTAQYIILPVLLCASIATLLFFNKTAAIKQLDTWKVLPRPERLTELYFTDHTHLPAIYSPGKPQTVMFTVHNLEHRPTQYHYAVLAQAGNKRQVLDEGVLMLKHGEVQNILRTVTIPPLDKRVEIQVNVQYDGIAFGQDKTSRELQDIHYWLIKQGDS